MKRLLLFLGFLMFCVTACEYQEPLSEKQNISIDPALLGLWEPAPEKDEPKPSGERILALKYSDTEYLIHYQTGSDSVYFRAYPLKIGDISCVQLQLIGNANGPLAKTGPAYQVAFVTLTGDEVTIRMINTSVVGRDLRGSALREAFLNNSKNSELFREPVKFRREKKADSPEKASDSLLRGDFERRPRAEGNDLVGTGHWLLDMELPDRHCGTSLGYISRPLPCIDRPDS